MSRGGRGQSALPACSFCPHTPCRVGDTHCIAKVEHFPQSIRHTADLFQKLSLRHRQTCLPAPLVSLCPAS